MRRLILVGAGGALIIASVLACFYGWPAYHRYRETRTLQYARRFLENGDLSNASLSARRVLQLNPKNAEACGIIAQLAEISHSSAAVDWWQRAAELAPGVTNRLRVVSATLRFERPPYALAQRMLHDLEPLAHNTAAFHVLSAELAIKLDQINEAIDHFEQAVRLEPTSPLHQFNLAVLHLQSTNQDTAARGRLALECLSTNRNLSLLALRCRIAESLHRQDLAGAKALSCRVLSDPGAQWDDHLQDLTILQLSHSPAFGSNLDAVQSLAGTNATRLFSISEWMRTHELADQALDWLARLDPKLREAQPLPLGIANLHLERKNWAALESFLASRQWGELDFLRLAFLARAASGQNQSDTAKTRWRGAVRAAAGRLGPSTLLLNLASEWEQDPEELLWEIGRRFPGEPWAWQELQGRYQLAGNTRGLNLISSALMSSQPNSMDLTNRNNFATTSMLLKVNLPKAHETARDLYLEKPEDPIIASTYAYSLHLQGKTQDGLTVFTRLKPEALQVPAIALYYGVLLSAGGRSEQAGQYLALAESAPLLPEERQLLLEARNRL